jgi:type I site-specific restriction-modification system R (restriction) subunit
MEKFREARPNQIPALHTLMKLGYTYIPSEKSNRKPLLENVLEMQLRKLNPISHQKKQYLLNDENIFLAIEKLRTLFQKGIFRANEKIYHLITTPQPFSQMVEGIIQNFSLVYIDWNNWENNVYHCTSEFFGKRVRRGDIVLFINGIPLAVLPCNSPEGNTNLETIQEEQKYLSNLSFFIRPLFSAKGKNNLLLHEIAKVHCLLQESFYGSDDLDQTLKVCEEKSPYIADIIEDHLKPLDTIFD